MGIVQKIVSLVDDVFAVILGKKLPTAAEQAVELYPYIFS